MCEVHAVVADLSSDALLAAVSQHVRHVDDVRLRLRILRDTPEPSKSGNERGSLTEPQITFCTANTYLPLEVAV